MGIIKAKKLSEVYMSVSSDEDCIEEELLSFFSFEYPGSKYHPLVKKKLWDGIYRLYSRKTKTLYMGLLPYLKLFAKERNYRLVIDNELYPKNKTKPAEIKKWIDELNIYANGKPIKPEKYQIDGAIDGITLERCILLSPTGSGKSLMMYCLMRWFLKNNKKCLIVVPNTSLVEQLYKNFAEYSIKNGFSVPKNVQRLYSGLSKVFSKNVMITTWQSIYNEPNTWFKDFDMIIGDEAHGFKSTSLIKLMKKMPHVRYRIGTTGTIDNKKIHKLILEGIFGSVQKISTFKEGRETGRLSDLKIVCIKLNYDKRIKNMVYRDGNYQNEIDFIVSYKKRNTFITELACNTKGNTLVLFNYVEKHGIPLLQEIQKKIILKKFDKQAYFISGDIKVEERERIRELAENTDNCIIVASYGTFSTGVNIPSIENIIFAHPYKSKIRNLQSIGRGLRVKKGKKYCRLYDICDDFVYKNKKNHTYRHALERYKIYDEEQFDKKLVEVDIIEKST